MKYACRLQELASKSRLKEYDLGDYDADGKFHGMTEEDAAKEFLESVDLEKIVEPKDKKEVISDAFISGKLLSKTPKIYTLEDIDNIIVNGGMSHSTLYFGDVVGEYYTFYEGKDMPIEEAIIKAFVHGTKCDGYIDVQKRLKQLGYTHA